MTLGKSHDLNNNLFSLFNTSVALLKLFLCSMSVYFCHGHLNSGGPALGRAGLCTTREASFLSRLIANPQPKPQIFFRPQRVNHRYLGGNLRGWAADDRLSVCCQVFLCCAIRFMTVDGAGEREILAGSAFFIWISAPSAGSLPVRCKWVTLARMWITVVTNTVVVNWPMVRVGGWEMGVREKGRDYQTEPSAISMQIHFKFVVRADSVIWWQEALWSQQACSFTCIIQRQGSSFIIALTGGWFQLVGSHMWPNVTLMSPKQTSARFVHHVNMQPKNASCALEFSTMYVFVQICCRMLIISCLLPVSLSKDQTGYSPYLTAPQACTYWVTKGKQTILSAKITEQSTI